MGLRALARLLVAIALLIGGAAAYYWWHAPLGYPVRGVDVSNHQGPIDWPALAADDVRFAWIKATEGGDWTDARFQENWAGAKAAGVARGAYHFYTLCHPVADQIAHIRATVPAEPEALPLAIDLEFGGNCKARLPVEDLRRDLRQMLEALTTQYDKRPILYITEEFDARYLRGDFADERFWLRSIARKPDFDGRDWLIWQYHNKGRRDGVTGVVDRNAFNGDVTAWRAFREGGR